MSDRYMLRALESARLGVGLASPGALVGAVLVKDGSILGEGFYTYDGVNHAEILALRRAGPAARGATLYVTLEPCSHTGRTPPCVDAIIAAGIFRVVAAVQDTNPSVHGAGFAKLRAAGIDVVVGVFEKEARRLNEAFFAYKTEHRPFGILKIAMTLDGKIATASGESQWITSEESRALGQELRHGVDAIVTGSGTFLRDCPRMTDRTGLPRRRELLRVVMDRRCRIPQGSPAASGWLIFRDSLAALQRELHAREIQSFLLECGPDLAFNAVHAGVVDKIVAFVAPKLLGGANVLALRGAGVDSLGDMIDLEDLSVSIQARDLICTAYVKKRPSTI